MKYLIVAILLITVQSYIYGQAPRRPFPQHVKYFAGVIMPSQIDIAQMAKITGQLYDDWKSAYLDTINGSMNRIIARPQKKKIL